MSLGTYLVLAALAFLPVWEHWSAQMNGCNCWDQLLQEWFIGWLPAAVGHGHSVFVTNYIYAPGGVNTMWNTSMFALGAVASPLTKTIGVVHTFDLLLLASFALSASTMFLLLRRWTSWGPSAWFGGLVYGFCPFIVEEAGSGRLHLAFEAVPPLIVLAIVKLAHEEWSPIKGGVVLGLLLTIQLFISEEILAITGVTIAATLTVLALVRRKEVARRTRSVVTCLGVAVATSVILLAYPLYVQFAGADRVTGPVQSRAQMALFSSDLLSFVTPGRSQWLSFSWTNKTSGAFSAALASEVTSYLGLPLLLIVVAATILLWKNTLVRVLAVIGLASLVCSLGPHLLVDNHNTGIPGIDALLAHVPVLGNVIPSRFAVGMWFAVAALFALALDNLRKGVTLRVADRPVGVGVTLTRAERSRNRATAGRVSGALAIAIGVVAVLPLVPNWPFAEQPANVPSFFTTSAVDAVPAGSLVATYPYPLTATAWPMLWQIDAGVRYRMLGGYAIGPGSDGAGTFFADPNPIEYCLLTIYEKASAQYCDRTELARAFQKLGVSSVIVDDAAPNAALARSVLDGILGTTPRRTGGVSLWRCAGGRSVAACRSV